MPSLGSSWPGSPPQTWPPPAWDESLLFSPNGTLSGEKHVALSAALKTGGAAAHLLSKGGRNKDPTLFLLRGQFSSVAQSCPTLCDPMDCSTPGLPVHHQLLEFTQTHVHWVGDAIQPSHPLSSPSPPVPQSIPASGSFPVSQLFASGGQSIGVSATTSVLPMNILKGHLPLTKCYLRTYPLHKQHWKTMKINPVILQVHNSSI